MSITQFGTIIDDQIQHTPVRIDAPRDPCSHRLLVAGGRFLTANDRVPKELL